MILDIKEPIISDDGVDKYDNIMKDGYPNAGADGIDDNRDIEVDMSINAIPLTAQAEETRASIEEAIMAFIMSKKIEHLADIKYTLDKYFKGTTCNDVIYTENTDKMFFGLNVVPKLNAKRIFDILQSDEPYLVPSYFVEIDSKLIESKLSPRQIADCILYDVSAMVSDANPMRKAQAVLDEYLISSNSVLTYTTSIHYLELLSFGIRDTMKKVTSMFYVGDDNIDKDFLAMYGDGVLGTLAALRGQGKIPYTKAESPIVVLAWVLRLYNSVLKYRIAARHTIRKGIKFTGSQLERKELDNIYRRLDRIDDAAVIKEDLFMGVANAISGQLKDMKAKGIAKYEDDFYEIQFEANNLETQEEAMLLLHRINSRMGVIADFLNTEELNATNRKKWTKLIDEYNKLRNTISKQKIYQNKTRLYVNYGYDD